MTNSNIFRIETKENSKFLGINHLFVLFAFAICCVTVFGRGAVVIYQRRGKGGVKIDQLPT